MSQSQLISSNLKQAPFWVALDQGAGRVVRIGASIILARLLFPEDFGIYALSLSLLELARLTGNFGIGTAIIQSSDDPDSFANSAFWVNISASLFMFINSFLLGWIGAEFLHSPKLIYTVPILGLTFISAGITHINYSLLVRSLEFKTVAKASVSRLTVESISSIIFAILGFGFWSFIYGYVLGDIVHSILVWVWTSWRPSMKPSFRYPRKYWNFGSHIFLFYLSTYLLEHLPNMIVGRIATVYVLGLFSFAWRQSRWTGDIPKLVGQNFLFPAFSRLQTDSVGFGKLYERWLRFMLVWGAPVFILQFALAPVYVPFIFGDKWIPSIAALQMLVVLAFTEVTFYVAHSEALTARGRVQVNAYWRILESIAVGIVLFFVSSYGSTAIAAGLVLARVGLLPVYLLSTRAKLEIHFRGFLGNVIPVFFMALSGWIFWPLLVNWASETNLIIPGVVFSSSMILWFILGFRLVPETKNLLNEMLSLVSQITKNSKYRVLTLIQKLP